MKQLLSVMILLFYGITAQAVPIFTLDDPNRTVVRPTSDFIDVDYYGELQLDEGDQLLGVFSTGLFSSSGDQLATFSNPAIDPMIYAVGEGYRFSVRVDSDSALGLYNLDSSLSNPAVWGFDVMTSNESITPLYEEFSVTVTDNRTSVPEPSSLLLMAIGLLSLGLVRLRKRL
jgi:hypothetical protein